MRSQRVLQSTSLVFVFILTAVNLISAQTQSWQELRPEGEEFSILMPKDPIIESGKMPYHRMELNTRLYLSDPQGSTTFAIVSLSGIKSNPAMYSEMERINSYVDAFKKLFVPRVAPKATVAKFVMNGPKVLNGHTGREYQVTIGQRTGLAHVFATRKRFYAIVFLADKKSDQLRDQFLSSFTLPEYVKPTPAVTAQTEKVEPAAETETKTEQELPAAQAIGDAAVVHGTNEPPKANDANDPNAGASKGQTETANGNTAPGQRKPVSGGVLNGKALSLPVPLYPPEARAAKVAGAVSVQVVIDEYGLVNSARAVSGHPLLRDAAVAAAMQAIFPPTKLMGEPVKVTGVIVYNFTAQ